MDPGGKASGSGISDVVMPCQVFRPEEGGRIRAELDPDEFPLFLGFWGSEDKWKGYENVGGGEIGEIGEEGDAMWMCV